MALLFRFPGAKITDLDGSESVAIKRPDGKFLLTTVLDIVEWGQAFNSGVIIGDHTVEGSLLVEVEIDVLGGITVGENLTVLGFVTGSFTTDLEAVGSDRDSSLLLLRRYNLVTIAASSAVGVRLQDTYEVGVGGTITVYNDGPSNSFHVYGSGSDTIDGIAGDTGVTLTNGFSAAYVVIDNGIYKSYRSPIVRSS